MLFSSLIFLCGFLPVVLAVYYILPDRFKNAALLIFSIIFYIQGEPKFFWLLALSAVSAWLFGRLLCRKTEANCGKHERYAAGVMLAAGVGVHLAGLIAFKYLGAGGGVLPLGISFYTFQCISYLVDVYRGEVSGRTSFMTFVLYIALFPQLVAGPIVRYSDIAGQMSAKSRAGHLVTDIHQGMRRFIPGLFKKAVLADGLGMFITALSAAGKTAAGSPDMLSAAQSASGAGDAAALGALTAVMTAIAYMLQIYFDFSGYSDMAIGLGHFFGFTFPENFRAPYKARSITDFWRRWHMTLGGWFRDYVYIPLGGGHCALWRQMLNILIVWGLTGIWHGQSVNFLLWGLYFAVFLLAEKFCLRRWPKLKDRKPDAAGHLYVLVVVCIGFIIFRTDTPGAFVSQFGELFHLPKLVGQAAGMFVGNIKITQAFSECLYEIRNYGGIIILSVMAVLADRTAAAKYAARCRWPRTVKIIVEIFALSGLLVLSAAALADGSYQPFIYYRF